MAWLAKKVLNERFTERFIRIWKFIRLSTIQTILPCSLTIINDNKPPLILCQVERSLSVFLVHKNYYYCSWQLESTSYATKINNLRKITKVMITKLVQELFKTFSPQILMDFADISSVAESIYGFIISWNANQQIQEFLQLPGLLTKLPFSTGDLKDIKKYLFCYMKMLVWIGNKWANTTERKSSL